MPVILRPRDYARWLARDPQERPPVDLLRAYDAAEMTMERADNTAEELLVEPNSE